MAKENGLAPSDILLAIEKGSKNLNEQAKGLTSRIVAFETWINTIPGRIETTLSIDTDPEDELQFLVQLHRSGKSWILSTAYHHPLYQMDETPDWQPAKEVSIETQIAVLRALPKLLINMADTQRRTTKRIGDAQAEFDVFAKAFGFAEGEG